MNRLVLGIDIGLYHMGIVQVETSEEWNFIGVKYCELVDITDFKCNEKDCEYFMKIVWQIICPISSKIILIF